MIAGIVVSCVAVIAIIALVIILLIRRKSKNHVLNEQTLIDNQTIIPNF